jgi:hypothetical protein
MHTAAAQMRPPIVFLARKTFAVMWSGVPGMGGGTARPKDNGGRGQVPVRGF